ncbi:deoxynucleotidyltransferase terminal-interacting protein 2 [Rhynchophorus ferrugineus]|uniref:deoxynucleotidyltransferase terminal-interacting protein 2 n=1 Tax=Rhynchophorus ferrugineus TaxID=354439 RepID=UPI003FCEB3C6
MDFLIDTLGDNAAENSCNFKSNSTITPAIKEFLAFKEQLFNSQENKVKAKTNKPLSSRPHLHQKSSTYMPSITKHRVQGTSVSTELKDALTKSVITPNFEELHQVPSYKVGKKALQKEKKKEKEKTKGKKWYGMPRTEMTEELQRDLEVLQMRSVLDPKHFYKKNDLQVLPKYFQIGVVMDSPLDYYNSRLTKKERKNTLVDELLADAEFQKYNKHKYKEIMEEKQKTHYKAWKKAKKNKKKK